MRRTTSLATLAWLSSWLVLLHLVNADTSVHILSTKYGHGQLVTSSILNWIPDSHYSASKDFVIGGFVIVDSDGSEGARRPIFVCRALHNGIWVAGGQKEGEKRCTVTLTGSVRSYERYQLLENVESAARVSWSDWSKYYQPPLGAVATDKLYVARHVASEEPSEDGRKPSQTHYVGTLNSEETLGTITYVKENGEEASADNGQLLVETEPISYDLSSVKFIHAKRRVLKRVPRVLAETTISNTGSEPAMMAEALTYSYVHAIYWGQGQAMLRGLNTSVTLQNKTKLPDMNWGIEIRENRTNVYTVEIYLEPGTAVNVSLQGEQEDIEIPYTCKLFSHYEDMASVNPRTINGMRREETISNVRPDFGPIYYLGNFSIAPTTAPPPTTEPATSTTAPSTSRQLTTAPAPETNEAPSEDSSEDEDPYGKEMSSGDDENAILAKRPEVSSGMQGDDGGPLSLKDKPEGSQSHAPAVILESLLLVLGSVILARVT